MWLIPGKTAVADSETDFATPAARSFFQETSLLEEEVVTGVF